MAEHRTARLTALRLTAIGLAAAILVGLTAVSSPRRPEFGDDRVVEAPDLAAALAGSPGAPFGRPGRAPSPADPASSTGSAVPVGSTVPIGSVPVARLSGAAGCPAVPGAILSTAPGRARTVALTFDDGPGQFTGQVLDLLRRYHVHASFFLIGNYAAADPGTVRRIAAEGHLIGDHSWSHRYPRQLAGGWTPGYLTAELDRTDRTIAAAIGRRPCWFRPPGGFLQSVVPAARATRHQIALWSVDPVDWKVQQDVVADPGNGRMHAILRAGAAGGRLPHPVILLHDGGGWRGGTVGALPGLIRYYRDHGYRFVRLDGRS
jgi:peptidoglycan-N-acetylglucosamine deacetylase